MAGVLVGMVIVVTCVHHWLIDPPEGPTSPARCQLCGAVREFQNYQNWQGRGKLSRSESAELRRQMIAAGGDDGEYVS